mmetsp:Transcript_18948/g.18089  ORF Transcript_18948/g.18089 Transcript_18948/m.18089 type:complete len:83 (+) Transcript_18948:75-323(+)
MYYYYFLLKFTLSLGMSLAFLVYLRTNKLEATTKNLSVERTGMREGDRSVSNSARSSQKECLKKNKSYVEDITTYLKDDEES